MVKNYEPEDFEQICKWLELRGKALPDSNILPDTGLVVPGVACGFVYLTNSDLGFIEWYVTNPEASALERGKALQEITEGLIARAKASGVKYLSANTEIESIAWLAKKNGFDYTGKFLTFFRGV